MSWNPIQQAHSIEAVVWRVTLDQPLLQRHQALIQEKDARLRTVLPRTETAQRLVEIGPSGVTVHADGVTQDPNAPAMLTYQRYAPNGQLDLLLEVNGDAVTAVSHGYSRWSNTGGVVRRLLADVGAALRGANDVFISQLELEYKDVFWWDGVWCDGALVELLEQDEWLVPAWVFGAGPIWHSDQGKVVEVDGLAGGTAIERMFLQGRHGTVNGNPCPLLVVLTTLRWLAAEHGKPSPLKIQTAFADVAPVGAARDGAQARFDAMHERAVDMFRTVLKPPMRRRIGMARSE